MGAEPGPVPRQHGPGHRRVDPGEPQRTVLHHLPPGAGGAVHTPLTGKQFFTLF